MSKDLILVLALCAGLCVIAVPANAQVLYGSLVGTVEDTSGSLVPGAAVQIVNHDTGAVRETTTIATGVFTISDVLPGSYTLSVSAKGFRTFKVTDVSVRINAVSRVNAQLQVGELSESVVVAADATAVQTDKADVHVALGAKEVTELPLPAYRSFQALINLVPGTTPAGYANAVSGSPGRSLVTNVNGTTNSNNNTRLDGASNMRASLPHQNLYIPPAESIEVVNIATNSFDAEQGFAGGAAINVATKSGTNDFHGVAFGFHSNSALKAKNFFYTEPKKPKYIINTYGGTLGGPIRRNKLFFFASWEGLRERSNYSRFMTLPDAKQRAGDFGGLNVTLYDPASGNPNGTGRSVFPGNLIPTSRQSSITRKMQALLPDANLSGTANNYFGSSPVSFDRDNYDGKLNWTLSGKTNIWGKYSAMKALVSSEFSLGKAGGSGMLNGGGAGTGDVLMQVVTIGGVHTFSPNFVMDGNIAVSRDPLSLVSPDIGTNYGLEYLGIPGTNGPNVRYSGLPTFAVSGYETMGNSETYMPKYIRNTYFTYTVNFGLTKGSHEMRWGLDIARYRVNQWHPELGGGPRGYFAFNPGLTGLNGGTIATNQFNAYAGFLLGLVSSSSKSQQPEDTTPRQWLNGLYFRDRWQVTRNLTLTLGLRWEYYPLMTRERTGLERYDPDTNKVYIGGLGGVDRNAGIDVSKKLFAPRLGLAYRLGRKSVIRTGYGISINPYTTSTAESFLFPFPVSINNSYNGPNSWVPYGKIEDGIPIAPYPDTSKGELAIPLTTSTVSLEKGLFNRGYIESYNLIVERELPGGFVASAGYVATRTIRQGVRLNINASSPGLGEAGRPLNRRFGRTADTQMFKPFLGARYDSLQARLDRQFSQGLLKLSYTWSKATDYTDGEGGTLMWPDPSQLARNRAVAGYDRTQTLRAAWVADLPFGAGRRWGNENPISRAALSGWQVNGILSAYTGTPFTVGASGTSLNAPGQSQTADQVKPAVQKIGAIGRTAAFYDPTAFVAVTRVGYGNSGRNILRGPGLVNVDLSVFRNFRVTEKARIQLRAEAFNVSNTPHFGNPSASVSTPSSFMTITSASSSSNNVEGGERVFRFALRLSF